MTGPRGLKLALEGKGRDDRRLRFANVQLSPASEQREVELVTDARGRMQYRLAPGRYSLRTEHGGEAAFAVGSGWTMVRLPLP